jgi:hypothetical protein
MLSRGSNVSDKPTEECKIFAGGNGWWIIYIEKTLKSEIFSESEMV